MKFLGVEILQSIISYFETIRDSISLEYLLYIFIGIEVLTILVFAFIIHNVYELKLMRSVDKLNAYLYSVQYIDEKNLIEFNNMMKRVPKTLRYHWQQYMLYREKSPSHYMSIENCIDRPIKASAFSSNIRIIKIIGILYAILSFIFCCGWASGLSSLSTNYFVTISMIPLVVLFINYIFVIALNALRASNTRDLYQTFHIFNRFIDKGVSTLPEYVDFEVLFTRKEIKRGIPVLNEYIEKRQIQEQEEMKRARENAVQHELYNFDEAGEKGELVLERAMKETEVLVSLRNRLNVEIEQIEKAIDSCKRTYENNTKDYQKKLQASKENVDRLREQQEATTNRIESNYIRKQQSDEIKKQEQIEKDQDAATLRYNQEINSLTEEIKKRKNELEEARLNVEKAMVAEYKTFANKIFTEIRSSVSERVKDEKDKLINSKEMISKELEEALLRVEQLEKQNKVLVTKAGERESFIRAELGKDNQKLLEKIAEKDKIIEEKDQFISLVSENPKMKIKEKLENKIEIKKVESKKDKNKQNTIIEGEFSFEDNKNKFYDNFNGPIGKFDDEGNYRYENGTYYDADGNFHDENNNVYDINGNLINAKIPTPKTDNTEKKIEVKNDYAESFEEFDIVDKSDTSNIDEDEEDVNIEENENSIAEVLEEEPARKRGRPRKEKTEEVIKPKGKRGRPRKEKIEVEEEPARKRGRPRKDQTEEVIKPKGKRGRPRKEQTEEVIKPKGKRGRPRKEQTEEVIKPKGKRGRPRKIDIDDLKAIEIKIKKENEILKGHQEDLKRTIKKATKK